MTVKTQLTILCFLFLMSTSVFAQTRTFDESNWQQKDSIIATLYQGGALKVAGVMIENAYEAVMKENADDEQALAVFSFWQGVRYLNEEDYPNARKYLEESRTFFESNNARSSRKLDLLLNLADLELAEDNLQEYFDALDDALEYMEKDTATDPLLYHNTLMQSLEGSTSQGDYERAQEYGRKALRNAQQKFSNHSNEYFQSLLGLGQISRAKGETRRASNLILQAYELAKTYLPPDNSNKLFYGSHAVNVLKEAGRYTAAETIYEEMLSFFDDNPAAKDDNVYPVLLDEVGGFYQTLGQMDKAYDFYNRANILFALRLDREDPRYIQSQINVGNILNAQGKYTEAEGYYLNALQHANRLYGENSWSEALLRRNLGNIYKQTNQYSGELAEREKVKEISELVWGPNHQQHAFALLELGNSYGNSGDKIKAKEFLESAYDKFHLLYGKNSPQTFEAANALIPLYWGDDPDKLIKLFSEQSKYISYYRSQILPLFEVQDRNEFEVEFIQFLSRYNAFVQESKSPESISALHAALYDWKQAEVGVDPVAMISYLQEPTDLLKRQFNKYQTLRKRIVDAQALTIAERKAAGIDLDQLLQETNELVSGIFSHAEKITAEPNSLSHLISTMDPDAAFIDFYQLPVYSHESAAYGDDNSYLVFVTRGKSGKTDLVNLVLDNNVVSTDQLTNVSAYANQIWKPIEKHLSDVSKIDIYPDGLIHKVSFAAMPAASGKYLIDNFNTKIISGTSRSGTFSNDGEVLILGDIDYYTNPNLIDSAKSSQSISMNVPLADIRSPEKQSLSPFSTSQSSQETSALLGIFKKKKKSTVTLRGREANKINLQDQVALKSFNWLHILTASFFGEVKDTVNNLTWSSPTQNGLAFSGAQTAWSRDSLPEGTLDNGLMTALELSTLDLSESDLLALPALNNTGSAGGNSLEILKNALKATGVRNIIYPAWPVSQQDRTAFFQLFYKNLLKMGSVEGAFRKTQLKLKKKNDLRMWAGFTLIKN